MTAQALSRWEKPTDFAFNDEYCTLYDVNNSIAGCINYNVANYHDFIMSRECSKWVKIPAILLLDLPLLATAPIVAVAEAVVRTAIAIITSPILMAKCCSESEWTDIPVEILETAFYSLVQIPNTLRTVYLTFTSTAVFSPKDEARHIMNTLTKDINVEAFVISLACVQNIFTANLIDAIKASNAYGWVKTITILALDVALCLTAPILALAEVVVRLAFAIIISPLLLLPCIIDSEVIKFAFLTAVYSLAQIPNAFVNCYLSLDSSVTETDAKGNTEKIANKMLCK